MRFVPLLVLSLVSSMAAAATPQGARRAVERAYADGSAHMPYDAKLGRTRILASYPKGGARGAMNRSGFSAPVSIVAVEIVGGAQVVGQKTVKTFVVDETTGKAEEWGGHYRIAATDAGLSHVAIDAARSAHGPNAFAAPVALAPRGRAVIFESYQHEGPRSRILVTTDGKRSTTRTLRGAAPAIVKPPPAAPAPPMSAALRAELQAIWASATATQ